MKQRYAVWGIAGVLALGIALAIPSAGSAGDSPELARNEVLTLSRSIEFFEGRLATDPENFLAAGHLADRLILRFQLTARSVDVERAEQVARGALNSTPNPAGARARLSAIHLTQHEFVAALAAAEQAVEVDQSDVAALSALFDAAMASGRYDRAKWAAQQLPAGSSAQRLRTAQWLAAHGETDAAFAAMEQTCEHFQQESLRPQLVAWCLTELAGLQNERAGPSAARELLKQALRTQPGYRGAIEALADLAHADGNWGEAGRLYRSIATDAHPDLYLRLVEVSRAQGDGTAAKRYEQDFLRVAAAPGAEVLHAHPLAMFYAAHLATRDAALEVALRDVARRPAVESYAVLSWVRFQRGELREALAASDSAWRWGAPSPTMQYQRARILSALGQDAKANALMREALQRTDLLDPETRMDLRSYSRARLTV